MNDIPSRRAEDRPGADRPLRRLITCFAVVELIGLVLLVMYLIRRS